jgi:hypothetical protein
MRRFQPVAGERWDNGNLKMITNGRPLDRLSPTIEREATILTAVDYVLSLAHTIELGLERRILNALFSCVI